jgi:hypothetical protein
MFTIKAYTQEGRCVIKSAESFTILRTEVTGEAEITLHQKNGEGLRVDIAQPGTKREEGCPQVFHWAIIENAAGNTTEVIRTRNFHPGQPAPRSVPADLPA